RERPAELLFEPPVSVTEPDGPGGARGPSDRAARRAHRSEGPGPTAVDPVLRSRRRPRPGVLAAAAARAAGGSLLGRSPRPRGRWPLLRLRRGAALRAGSGSHLGDRDRAGRPDQSGAHGPRGAV